MSKKREIVKNQHYVPKLYLRNFCKHKDQVAVYFKSSGTSFFTNIVNIANENYFYDDDEIDKSAQSIQVLEKYFHPLEDRMKIILNTLLNRLNASKYVGFSDDERIDISMFLVYQFMRTKEQREIFGQLNQELIQMYADEFIKSEGEDPTKYKVEIDGKYFHTRILLDESLMDKLTLSLYKKLWVILDNQTEMPFLTSDHPVVKYGHLGNEIRSMSGFNSRGVEISFPLSPKYLLSIIDEEYANSMIHLDDNVIKVDDQRVLHYNSLQIIKSYDQLFSNINSFGLAKEILEEEPVLKDPNRSRVQHITNSSSRPL
ncbi:MAG: DUF4238 domain-containing protein [Ignavibacteriales bacterium]|nr:DUF4238 domain-containing protein [Ignavibacteriales bacterium]